MHERVKMMWSKKGHFLQSLFIPLTLCYESPSPKLIDINISIISLHLNMKLQGFFYKKTILLPELQFS